MIMADVSLDEILNNLESDDVEIARGVSYDDQGDYVVNRSKTLAELMQLLQ